MRLGQFACGTREKEGLLFLAKGSWRTSLIYYLINAIILMIEPLSSIKIFVSKKRLLISVKCTFHHFAFEITRQKGFARSIEQNLIVFSVHRHNKKQKQK